MSNTARIGLGALILFGLLLAYLLRPTRDLVDSSICDHLYRKAASAQDTAVIDRQLAPKERGRGDYQGGVMTCGELRRLKASSPR